MLVQFVFLARLNLLMPKLNLASRRTPPAKATGTDEIAKVKIVAANSFMISSLLKIQLPQSLFEFML